MTDEFLVSTLDVWSMPTESARRVGHPAPFPVELPEQLIKLYTFEDDLVLDPFMGSGSSLVAASRLGRRYVGYDLDPAYVAIARERVAHSESEQESSVLSADLADAATADGKSASRLAEDVVSDVGFTITARKHRVRGTGATVSLLAEDAAGDEWMFDVAGLFTTRRGGLQNTDAVWRALGKAHAIRGTRRSAPYVLLTTHLPKRSTEGATALRAAGPSAFFDAVEMLSSEALGRLQRYAKGGFTNEPLPGFWTAAELTAAGAPPPV